jgi:hypothetical protein
MMILERLRVIQNGMVDLEAMDMLGNAAGK